MANVYPITVEQTLLNKLQNFSDLVYTLNPTDHLTRLMEVLLGPSGTGQFGQVQQAARSTQNLANMQFLDLDTILGSLLGISRTYVEEYSGPFNPFIDQILPDDWQAIYSQDASYRERLKLCVQGLQKGGTALGLALLAEGIAGVSFNLVPGWKNSGLGRFSNNPNEFILIPLLPPGTDSLEPAIIQALYAGLQNLKPAASIATVVAGASAFNNVPIRTATADSEWFELDRAVVAPTGVITLSNNTNSRYWLQPTIQNQVNLQSLAPTFSGLQFQDLGIDLTDTIDNVTVTVFNSSFTPVLTPISNPQWTQWFGFGLADSPDNYPGYLVGNQWIWGTPGPPVVSGTPSPYAGDANHYLPSGAYNYSWASQAAYIAVQSAWVLSAGGQISADNIQFRLPIADTSQPSGTINPLNDDMLSQTGLPIYSTVYGAQ